jgi:hypothetical protein
MHAKFPKSGFLAVGFLAACLLAGAVPVAAAAAGGEGDRPVPPNHGFLFDKDAYAIPGSQVETFGSQPISKLSLRLYGGYGRISAGDINEGSDGYFELIKLYESMGTGTTTGDYNPVHGGYGFGGDLIYQLSPKIGLGVGVGYLRHSADSLMTWTGEGDITLTATPTVSAIPVRLALFVSQPIGNKLDLTADAGATFFAGLKFDATQRIDIDVEDWMEMSVSGSRSSLSANLGFQGSLGLEYKFSPKMGFFVEAMGRYAKLKNFASVTARNEDSDSAPETTVGKLYIADYTFTDGSYSLFTVEETPPVDDPPNVAFREPKIDLSGFSLQAGIRIRL